MKEKNYTRQDIDQLDKRFRTNLINSLTGFKSVVLVGTADAAGTSNLAIFSQVIHVGANPPLVGILFRPHTVPRHTLENILATEHFTINHIQPDFVERAHHSSARWDVSEFEACELTPVYREGIAAPFVEEAVIQIGLRLVEKQTLASNETVLVVGEIIAVQLPKEHLGADGFVDLEAAQTVTCSGLDAYHTTQKLMRLSYAKPDEPLERLVD